jgi:hypothetical protein
MHTSRSRWIVGPLVVGPPVNGEDVLHLSNEHLGNEPSALLGWDPPLAMPVRLESVVDLSVVDLSVVDLSVWSVWRTVS